MSKNRDEKNRDMAVERSLTSESREIVKELFPLSGRDALNRLLDQDNPLRIVQGMTRVDFFWVIKKIGEDDSFPILSLASPEQWQYLLDMELWQRGRIDLEHASSWLGRLHKADPERVARWLFSSDGNLLSHYYFYRVLHVIVKEDEDQTIPEGFITFDNVYYMQIQDKENEEVIGRILRFMADEDFNMFQALLMGLAGILPDEVEEEMYRLKGVRLAEDGYLPYEEAISVYSYQKADLLKKDESEYKLFLPSGEEARGLVPLTPFIHTQGDNLMALSIAEITDSIFLDRLRLEFAGLCNQIFSADAVRPDDPGVLAQICRKASGYINVGLERLSQDSIELAKQYMENNPLIAIFRAGFGIALELKWEAEQWVEDAWFLDQGLEPDFWGDEWGGYLRGFLQEKPLFFRGLEKGEEYRDFEQISEVEYCRTILHRLMALDRLLAILSSIYPLDEDSLKDPLLSFHPILFSLWARGQLGLDPGFGTLSLEQVGVFLGLVRGREKEPPFGMPGFRETFVRDFMGHASDLDPDLTDVLEDTLSQVWQQFSEEYAWVTVSDLDERFAKFFLIHPASESD